MAARASLQLKSVGNGQNKPALLADQSTLVLSATHKLDPPTPASALPGGKQAFTLHTQIRAIADTQGCFNDLIIVLDKSFSMHENEQLEISKRAIEVVIQQFAGAWDNIGLVAFDEENEVVFSLGPIKDEEKEGLIRKIKAIKLGTTTNIQDALEEALRQLSRRSSEDKESRVASVLLLTDGSHNESRFSYVEIDRLVAESNCSGIYCLAVGREADQRFLFQLAERYGGQAAYIDTLHNLNKVLTGTFFRFFGSLASVTARDVKIQANWAVEGVSLDFENSELPATAKILPASTTTPTTGPTVKLGQMFSEQRVHVGLHCQVAKREAALAPGATLGNLVLTYWDVKTKAVKTQSVVVTLPVPLGLQQQELVNHCLLSRTKGTLTLDGLAWDHGSGFLLDGRERTIVTQPATQARLHLAPDVVIEPLQRCVLKIRTTQEEGGAKKLFVVVESGKVYVHSPSHINVRRHPTGRNGEVEISLTLPAAPASLPPPPPSPATPPVPTAGLYGAGITNPRRQSKSGLAHPASGVLYVANPVRLPGPAVHGTPADAPNHRLFLDAVSSSTEATATCLGGVVQYDEPPHPTPQTIPLFNMITFTKKAGGSATAAPPAPGPMSQRTVVDAIGSPAYHDEVLLLTREAERAARASLLSLIEQERSILGHDGKSHAVKFIEKIIQPLLDSLAACYPHALETMHATALPQGTPADLGKGLSVNHQALEFVAARKISCLHEELARLLKQKDGDLTALMGHIRQLAQVIDQERALVDAPDSLLHGTSSQRSFTVKGFGHLGVDASKLVARYKEAFGEDLDSLIDHFDSMQELKHNQWGIPIGIVQNRVEVYTKRVMSARGEGSAPLVPDGLAKALSATLMPKSSSAAVTAAAKEAANVAIKKAATVADTGAGGGAATTTGGATATSGGDGGATVATTTNGAGQARRGSASGSAPVSPPPPPPAMTTSSDAYRLPGLPSPPTPNNKTVMPPAPPTKQQQKQASSAATTTPPPNPAHRCWKQVDDDLVVKVMMTMMMMTTMMMMMWRRWDGGRQEQLQQPKDRRRVQEGQRERRVDMPTE